MNKELVLSASGIEKSFTQEGQDHISVLREISLELYKQESITILGSSGSGKSTLLQILGGLLTPDQGTVSLRDQSFSQMSRDQLAKTRLDYLGFVFQFHHLLPDLSALENVTLPLRMRGDIGEEERYERGIAALEKVGLSHLSDRNSRVLSGGEQQRVAIARALINNPIVLIADEPTGNLDPKNTEMLIDLMFSVIQDTGLSIVVATHDKNWTKKTSENRVLEGGYLV